jgi:hypothetical protein
MVVIGYFWGTYCVLYALPVPHDAYLFMDNISTVALSGHLGGNTSWYLNMYPLATVFFHELQLLTGIALPQVVRFYPVLSNGLLLLMLYAVARSALGPQGVVAPVALASCNWVSQWHMVPQNYAMLLTVPLVLLLASMFCGRGRQNPVHRLLFMVITLAIVLGHSSSTLPLPAGSHESSSASDCIRRDTHTSRCTEHAIRMTPFVSGQSCVL